MMLGRRGDKDSQERSGQTYSMAGRSMFAERRLHFNQYWKEEGFGYIYHALLMCEIMNPSTSKSVWLACSGALNDIQ